MVAATEFPVATLQAALWGRQDGIARPCPALVQSWQSIPEFRRSLLRLFSAQSRPPIKSSTDSGFDFYHDLVLRHRGLQTPALITAGSPLQPSRSTSYDELHAACMQRCIAWQAAGLRAGASICIVGALTPELVTALLSALCLGGVVSLLPALGPDYLRSRLQRLRPDYVATAPHYRRLLSEEEWGGKLLPDATAQGSALPFAAPVGSHTYEGTQAAFALFSPLRAPESAPLVMSAADAYAAALRDGLLLWRLAVGSPLWAPDGNFLEQQPALLLTTLLHGGTYVHGVSMSELAPQGPLPIPHVLFVRRALRDHLLEQAPRPLPGLRLWVVHPTEAADARWHDWVEHAGLQDIPAITAWVDSSAGGCTLFSAPQLGGVPQQIVPAPGLSYSFQAAAYPHLPAGSGCGVMRVPAHDADAVGIRLATCDAAFVYGGTADVLYQGQRCPAHEIEACVAQLPFVDAAVVLEVAGDRPVPILFVFLGPEPLAIGQELLAARCGAIREQVAARLGPSFVPPQIEVLAMYPRRRGGSVDREWLRREYHEASLRDREQNSVFRLLDQLRSAWHGPRLPTADAATHRGDSR